MKHPPLLSPLVDARTGDVSWMKVTSSNTEQETGVVLVAEYAQENVKHNKIMIIITPMSHSFSSALYFPSSFLW